VVLEENGFVMSCATQSLEDLPDDVTVVRLLGGMRTYGRTSIRNFETTVDLGQPPMGDTSNDKARVFLHRNTREPDPMQKCMSEHEEAWVIRAKALLIRCTISIDANTPPPIAP
jgi:hypothetical protein